MVVVYETSEKSSLSMQYTLRRAMENPGREEGTIQLTANTARVKEKAELTRNLRAAIAAKLLAEIY